MKKKQVKQFELVIEQSVNSYGELRPEESDD